MWDDGSFESRSFEPGSWLFRLVDSVRRAIHDAIRVTVTTLTRRSSLKAGKKCTIAIEESFSIATINRSK